MSTSPQVQGSASNGLSEQQLETWHKDGYLLIPDALSPSEVKELMDETSAMLHNFSLDGHPMTRFSIGEKDKHVGDDYFLSSGDKVHYFFEDDAFDKDGTLTKPKHLAINKIGHYLHHLSPPFQRASINAQNARIARQIGFKDPRVLQSMVICKQPEIGSAVPPHQDSTFLFTNPPSAVGFWYALEDCTINNGCLSFAAGSHRRAPIKERMVRAPGDAGTTFVENKGEEWPAGFEKEREGKSPDEETYDLGEVKAGTLVLIHGNLLHKSERNTSSKGRTIYTFHCIDGEHEYDESNWLHPPAEGFTKLNDVLV